MKGGAFERILVTGGTGFIGRKVTARLVAEGHRPVVTQLGPLPDSFSLAADVELIDLDLRDFESVGRLIDDLRPELVLHLAGVTGYSDPDGRLCDEINYRASGFLLERLIEAKVAKVVMIGSAAEYGQQPTPFHEGMPERPTSAYARSRACATRHALSLGSTANLPITILRLFSVYGIGQPMHMFLQQLITHAVSAEDFRMTNGGQLRDFVHVEDVASGLLQAATSSEANGRIINIAGGVGHSLSSVAKAVWRYCGTDESLLHLGAFDAHGDDAFDTHADISLAQDILGWRPAREFISNNEPAEALAEMIEYIREAKCPN